MGECKHSQSHSQGENSQERFVHAVLIINQVGKMSVGYIVVVSLYLVEE